MPKPFPVKIVVSVTCVVILTVVSALVFFAVSSKSPPTSRKDRISSPASIGRDFQMKGFRFHDVGEDGVRLSVSAAAVYTEKKKVGMFRIGGLRTAHFRNAEIDIFSRTVQDSELQETTKNIKEPYPQTPAQAISTHLPPIDIASAFRGSAASLRSGAAVGSIVMTPVRLRLHEGGSLKTEITSSSATLDIARKAVDFSGAVNVFCGGESFRARRLILRYEQGELRVARVDSN